MDIQMIQLNIPVPPRPILELAVGYRSNRNAHFLALWWEPAGDEAMVSDGFVTFTGNWPGYLAFVHHKVVYPYLRPYNLGSSDDPADYSLVIDLQERNAYIALKKEAEKVVARNWQPESIHGEPISLSTEDFETLIQAFVEQAQNLPTMDELRTQMEDDRRAVAALARWLDDQR
jgi:hypothetical protein